MGTQNSKAAEGECNITLNKSALIGGENLTGYVEFQLVKRYPACEVVLVITGTEEGYFNE
jgi:hypothetical protein